MANSKIQSFLQYFEETTYTGPVVGANPGERSGGQDELTGADIYQNAIRFIKSGAERFNVMGVDVRPYNFDRVDWMNAKKGTKLPARPEFIMGDLGYTLKWNHQPNRKGHWGLHNRWFTWERERQPDIDGNR